jgi:hypothetical protein
MSNSSIPVANPTDYNFSRDTMPLYLFQFGAYGDTRVYAWGCSGLEDALEAAAVWLRDNAPGVFHEVDYAGAAADVGAPEDWDSADNVDRWGERVQEAAEVDMTYTEVGYLASWEWSVSEVTDADTVAAIRSQCAAESEDE